MPKRLFAVDLGASGGKCFVGTFADGTFSMDEIHRFAHDGMDMYIPDRTGRVSPRTVWDDTFIYRNIIMGLQAYRRDVAEELDSIGIDTWGADGGLLNADGDMLAKMYCYRDHRLDAMVDKVKACVDPSRIYEVTGIHFQPFNLSNQLLWLVQNRPELLASVAAFLPVPSLFYYFLGGEKRVDSSWASVSQLMDAHTHEWSKELLDALGIPAGMLPEIVEPGASMGTMHAELADSLGLNRVPLTAAAAHDTASAFAAAPVEDPAKALIISSGTWSLVGKLVPEPITTPEAMAVNISNEGGVGNTRCLKNCMGTWLVQELRRGWAVEDGKEVEWRELDALTAAAPSFAAVIDPDDASFYNPDNMEEAIVAFCKRTGQAVPADRGSMTRTVYEGLALKYRMVNEQICRVSGTESGVVNIVGGGSKNVLLDQFTADALGLPVLAGPTEGTAVGNFMVQAVGLGIISTIEAAQPVIRSAFPIKEYQPGDKAPWDAAYERFKAIVG
ncbi:MAG: rhamnulokinase [Kiritimatiellae bacterium]|nr:rhamnulokinase [Kiritimatiellia bacterium]